MDKEGEERQHGPRGGAKRYSAAMCKGPKGKTQDLGFLCPFSSGQLKVLGQKSHSLPESQFLHQ